MSCHWILHLGGGWLGLLSSGGLGVVEWSDKKDLQTQTDKKMDKKEKKESKKGAKGETGAGAGPSKNESTSVEPPDINVESELSMDDKGVVTEHEQKSRKAKLRKTRPDPTLGGLTPVPVLSRQAGSHGYNLHGSEQPMYSYGFMDTQRKLDRMARRNRKDELMSQNANYNTLQELESLYESDKSVFSQGDEQDGRRPTGLARILMHLVKPVQVTLDPEMRDKAEAHQHSYQHLDRVTEPSVNNALKQETLLALHSEKIQEMAQAIAVLTDEVMYMRDEQRYKDKAKI
jgi:hypothetical protein